MGFLGKGPAKYALLAAGPVGMAALGADMMMGGDGDGGGGYNEAMFRSRMNQIQDFEKALAGARSRYLASVGNLYQNSYNRFAQNAEASFANRGLAVNGGAFGAELARKSADYQASLEPMALQAEREDVMSVEQMRAALFGQQSQMDNQWRLAKYNSNMENNRAIGAFAGNLIGMGIGAMAGGPAGASMGGQMGQTLFSPPPRPVGAWGGSPNRLNLDPYGGGYGGFGRNFAQPGVF